MIGQHPEEIIRHLDQANGCANDTWQMWFYVAEKNTLVLCGYRKEFNVKGFLVFRGVSYLRLQRWIDKPVFQLGEIETRREIGSGQDELDASDLHLISISTEASKYYVICQDVKFYAVPQGAYV